MDFNELLTRLEPKLKSITRRLDYRFRTFGQEDLFQEALIHLWEKNRDEELCGKTESFILQGCCFYLKNYIRKSNKSIDKMSVFGESFDYPGGKAIGGHPAANNESFVNSLDNVSLRDSIFKILGKRERKVAVYIMKGLSSREIGSILNISHVMVLKIKKNIRSKCHGLAGERQ
ncbi:MAG: sigma-70 family RNA polymerase sigma factor [Candidatus Omnitrophica bacterium]|nr:sigma-70 family RNA polymerase sigma factor [Candidatus Omnitrophota bacterium]MBD3269738.1 sigma-70 family RNA polymerase sigma factor [Candidatus Omnitrophota bacterium]